MILTGSDFNNCVGGLFFEKDGGVVLRYAPGIDQMEEESLVMAATFFEYALSRQDWMLEFLENEVLPNEDVVSHEISDHPKLRVIQGGLASGSIQNF